MTAHGQEGVATPAAGGSPALHLPLRCWLLRQIKPDRPLLPRPVARIARRPGGGTADGQRRLRVGVGVGEVIADGSVLTNRQFRGHRSPIAAFGYSYCGSGSL